MARRATDILSATADYPADHYRAVKADLERTFREVPFYAGSASAHPTPEGADRETVRGWLARLPTVSKKDVRKGFPKGWTPAGADLNGALAREEVLLLATSGTTEDRVQVLWDAGWWDPQERAAMRLNGTVARALQEPAYREAILTTPVCAGAVCHIGDMPMEERVLDGNLLFLNQVADPTYWLERDFVRMADELDSFRPRGIEADPAYLAAFSGWLTGTGRRIAQPAFVQLTYEFTTSQHLRAISRAFDAKAVQLYGSTESGVLFMECERGRLHANGAHTHVELVDVGNAADGAGRLARVIATTVGRRWMPLVRFDLGDLVLLDSSNAPCACGRDDGPVILGVEGRLGDLTWTAAGHPVTPGTIDRALAPCAGLEDWQVVQDAPRAVRLRFVGDDATDGLTRLSTLYGDGVDVTAERATAISPETSGKYRRSHAAFDPSAGTRLSRDKAWTTNPVFAS